MSEENTLNDQLRNFDEWFKSTLDRSFSDDVIISVLQYHVVASYVRAEIPIDHMLNMIRVQYESIENLKKSQENKLDAISES